MNLTLGLSMLLLTVVYPSGESTDDLPTPPSRPSGIQAPQPPLNRSDLPRSRSSGGPMDSQSPLYRFGTPSTTQRYARPQEQQVPVPPTDPDLRSPDSPLASPTEQGGNAGTGYGTPLGGNVPMGAGSRPNYRGASAAARSKSSSGSRYGATAQQKPNPQRDLAIMEQQTSRLQPSAGISAGAPSVSKPFSSYSPAPAVSPYMDLYRRDTGGADNYYSFVRPRLDQRRANQVLGGEIRGLQSNQRLQSHAVQKLGKATDRAQTGTMAPEYYQNFGSFYPGFNR